MNSEKGVGTMTQKRILELAYIAAIQNWEYEKNRAAGLPEEFQGRVKKAYHEVETIAKLLLKAEQHP